MHGEVPFDEESGAPLLGAEYGCKHCDALGAPCETCGADPALDDAAPDPACSACNGVGIVTVGAREPESDPWVRAAELGLLRGGGEES